MLGDWWMLLKEIPGTGIDPVTGKHTSVSVESEVHVGQDQFDRLGPRRNSRVSIEVLGTSIGAAAICAAAVSGRCHRATVSKRNRIQRDGILGA